MMQRARFRLSLVVLVGVVLGAFAATTLAHDPPRDLHLVDDHWTAWNPPTSLPEGAEVYTIQRGDTLWDLAQRFYGNSYLWPQLWERNPYILDAHWIYAGDPLVYSVEVTPIEQLAGLEDTGASDGADDLEGGLRLDRSVQPPVPLGSASDVRCSGFIADLDEEFPYAVAGSEYEALMPTLRPDQRLAGDSAYGSLATLKYDMTTGDILYVDSGLSSGLLPGTLYQIVSPREPVRHPETDEVIGRFYRYSGHVRVLAAQEDTAIAEIVQTCMPINIGDRMRPYEEIAIPLARRGRPTGVNEFFSQNQYDQAPVIVRAQDQIFSLGQDHVVYVDRGRAEVEAGDIFTIFRRNKEGLPPVTVGELGILVAHENSAVGKILESRYPVYVGDRLVLKN